MTGPVAASPSMTAPSQPSRSPVLRIGRPSAGTLSPGSPTRSTACTRWVRPSPAATAARQTREVAPAAGQEHQGRRGERTAAVDAGEAVRSGKSAAVHREWPLAERVVVGGAEVR
ncbi:hypothetical protein OG372_32135 [Streptomyces sp. NBC_01020]|uniref:hypothetical protein n=1 Tax=Streptomyces sp. NBC_01020 TaxID=2903722 RepID=UPI00386F4790|nr:hypothetical protein OG372_32135 [Streptomyces sp. NBC_01020]